MNQRIKLLAEQANELDYKTFDEYNHQTVQHYKFNKEKFAELLLQECAEVVDNHFESKTPGYPGDKIKQHFGVEE